MKPKTESSTLANTDLWSAYFRDEWARLLRPRHGYGASPLAQIADGAAAQVATWFTLAAAGPIAWMCAANGPAHAS